MRATLSLVGWSLRRSAVGIVSLLVGLALFELVQPVAIASFGDLDRLTPLLKVVPPSFWALLNVTPDFVQSAGLAGYLALGFTHPVFHVLVATTVIWFVARGLAGEMERGTIHLALARPVSRRRLFAARMAGVALVVTLVAVAGPVGMAAGLLISEPDGRLDQRNLFQVGVSVWLLAWAVSGIATVIAAAVSTMSKAVGIAIGVVVLSYVIDYFSSLWDALRPFEPVSFFSYYEPTLALAIGRLDGWDALVLAGVGLAGMLAGWTVFVRRDLPV